MVRALSLLSLLTLTAVLVAAEPPLRATPLDAAGTAARWAALLGDRDYHTREQASRELDALGEAALPALDKVIATGTPEAVGRATALATRIAARAENARAIAPKVVDIDLTDEPFGTALAEIQKQTGYQIRINGNQAVLGKKGDFSAKKEPFWVALDRLAALTGLEIESAAGLNAPVNVNRDLLAEQARMRLQVERDLLQARLNQAKVVKDVLLKQEAVTAQALARLTDELRKEKGPVVEKAIADVRKKLEANAAEIADLEKQFAAATAQPPPAGTVVLRAAGAAKSPTAVAGAVRLHATPFPGQSAQVSSEVIPLLITATPEPSFRWVRTTETIVTKATTPDGRVVGYDPTAAIPSVDASQQYEQQLQLGFRGRGRIRRGYYVEPTRLDVLGGYSPTAHQSLIRLSVPGGAAVTKLATVEGLMRAKAWTQPEAVAVVKSLSGEAVRVFGPNGVSLMAKLSPDPNDTSAHYLDVELVYDTTEVSPQARSSANDPLYLEQLPGGGVRAVRPRGGRPTARGNPQGLTLTDGAGNEFSLSLRMAETTALSFDPFSGGNRLLKMKQQYIVRPAKADTGAPARLTFNAIRLREVDLPFKLTDVSVSAGTLDPKAVAPGRDYIEIER